MGQVMTTTTMLDKAQLDALQVGDVVTRWLAGAVPQELKVTAIDSLIHCGPWTFHRDTGAEVDAELGWDGVTVTGSFLGVRGS